MSAGLKHPSNGRVRLRNIFMDTIEGDLMILGLRTYRTQAAARKPLVEFMLDRLRASGCRIIFSSPPTHS
jgi:hypothetical protein